MARMIYRDVLKRWCEKIIDQACDPATVQIGEVFLAKVLSMPTLSQPGNESLILEKLERVWRGEWEFEQSKFANATYGAIKCSRCKKIDTRGDERALKNYRKYTHFCPKCGALMTDEAVQMAMERLEAIFSARNDD